MQESTDSKHKPARTSRAAEKEIGSTPAKKKKEKNHKPAQLSKQKCAFMYVGPNVPGGRLFTGSLYRDALPKHLDEDFEKLPEMKKLFVNVCDLPKIKIDLREPGKEAYRLYQVVELAIMEGVLKNGI